MGIKRYIQSLVDRYHNYGFSPQQGFSIKIADYSPALLTESLKIKKENILRKEECVECKGAKAKEALKDVLEKCDRLLILGEPGAGKSTMLHHICYEQCLYTRKKKWKGHVPIFLRVRDWADKQETLIAYLEGRFLKSLGMGKDAVEASFFQDLWNEGKCLLLIDGLDEAGGKRHYIEAQIADLCQKGKKGNRIVVSSRIIGFRHNFMGFSSYEIADLEQSQILAISSSILGSATKAKVFWESVGTTGDLYSFIGNPFLLAMVAKQYLLNNEELPETKIEIIDLISDRFFQINNVNGLDRERFRNAANQLLTTIASWYFHGKRTLQFNWSDLDREIQQISRTFPDSESEIHKFLEAFVTDRGLLWESSKGVFEFQHRTLHEYYCGKFVASQENPFQMVANLFYHEDYFEVIRFTVAILGHDKRLKDKEKVNSFVESVLATKPKFSEYLFQPEIFGGICIGEAGNLVDEKYRDKVLNRIGGIVLELRECNMITAIRAMLHLWSGKGWLDGLIERVIDSCIQNPDPVDRLVLVELIGEIGPKEPRAMEFLREIYFEDPIVFVRSKAIEMLVKWRSTEYLPVEDLLNRLENEPAYINVIEMEDAFGVLVSEYDEVFDKLIHLVKTTTIEDKDHIYDVFQERHFASEKTVQFLIGQLRTVSDEFDADSILQGLYNHRKFVGLKEIIGVMRSVKSIQNPRGFMLLSRLYSFLFPIAIATLLESFIVKGILRNGLFPSQLHSLGRNGWFHKELIDSVIRNFQSLMPISQAQAIKYLGSASKISMAAQDFLKHFAANNLDDGLGVQAMIFVSNSEPNKAVRLQFLQSFLVPNTPILNEVGALLLIAKSDSINPEQVERLLHLYPFLQDDLKAAVLKNVRFLPPSENLKDFVFKILESLPSHEILFEAVHAIQFLCDEDDDLRVEETLFKILREGKPEMYMNLEEWKLDHPSQALLEINLPMYHTPSVVRDGLWDIFLEEQYGEEVY